jgi:hypothetical protein
MKIKVGDKGPVPKTGDRIIWFDHEYIATDNIEFKDRIWVSVETGKDKRCFFRYLKQGCYHRWVVDAEMVECRSEENQQTGENVFCNDCSVPMEWVNMARRCPKCWKVM